MKDDRLYLLHITECIHRVEQYTIGGKESFLGDYKTQDAILRNLQTMAEATQRLSEMARAKHPEIDWRSLAGFRNVLVHDYLGVDFDEVWRIISLDLPKLKEAIISLCSDCGLQE